MSSMDENFDREELERLRQSEARYRLLAESASDLIIQYDAEGVIQYASPSAVVFGYRPEELVGRKIFDFGHPDDNEARRNRLRATRDGVEPRGGIENERRLRHGDGSWVWTQGNPTVLRDTDGRVTGVVTILRNVTERRALEEELTARRAEAAEAVAARAELLANVSHEIRTPLTAVVGFAGLLAKMADLPERARTYADRIGRSGEALAAIVTNVLDHSRVEAGQVQLRPAIIDVTDLIEDAVAVVQDKARGKGLALDIRIAPGTPRRLLVDDGRLRQVILNLLANAVKFTPAGGVTAEVGYDAGEARLLVRVRDTGIGIAPEAVGRLFKRFSQVARSDDRGLGGVGLGLAISKGLVELMGGEIGVESVEGQGSTFWFAVPAPAASGENTPRPEEDAAPALTPLRLLLVDDARPNRELIMALLGPFNIRITEAADGAAAVDAARREPFDVVLMDLQMPGMDGMAAAREIRKAAAPNQRTPILAVSASVLPSDVEACHAAGMNDHIAKPIDARELVGKIARWTTAEAHQPA